MDRDAVVAALAELALLSELAGENPFKARAYAGASRSLARSGAELNALLLPGALESLPGVGKGTAALVRTLLATGRLPVLEDLRSAVPAGVRDLLTVPGLGPKRAVVLWRDLGLTSLGQLEYACLENRLAGHPGFGAATQAKVLEGARFRLALAGRMLLPAALAALEPLEAILGGDTGLTWVRTGETARCLETVGCLSLLAAGPRILETARSFGLAPRGRDLVGTTPGGLSVVLRSCEPGAFGAVAVWEASSESFRNALAERLARGGLFWDGDGLRRGAEAVWTPDEPSFWRACALPPIPAECREFPDALDADLGDLVRPEDLRGAFHVHTDWSDGSASIEEMARAAVALGWEWLGICDHSASAPYAGGLDASRLGRQVAAVREIQARLPEIRLFAGVESDILADGSLDYTPEVLAGLDLVVASVHSRFSLDEEAQTARLVRAVQAPGTTILGHPTGRLLLAREPYAHRWDEVAAAAVHSRTCVELNANPHRLDVDWRRIPALAAAGVPLAVNPDAHSVGGLKDVAWGILAARKGLARRGQVWNTLSADDVGERLATRRRLS